MANRILTALANPPELPAFITNKIKTCSVAKPYNFIFAAGLGLITAVFAAVFFVVILIVLNFNLLGWTE